LTAFIKAQCGTEILVSPEDLGFASEYKWHLNKGYARTQTTRINGVQNHILLHRIIAKAKEKEIVDHINRIKTDNRRENLRVVNPLTNCLNRNAKLNGASKFKGVAKQKNKWQVYINGKYFGIFNTEMEAALVYDENVVSILGSNAVTNKELGLL